MLVPRDHVILFAERGVIGYQRPGNFFACVCFFGMNFHIKNKSAVCLLFATAIANASPNPSPP